MDVPNRDVERNQLGGVAGLIATVGGGVGLIGAYWDDAWHTDRGRDGFAIPPHLTLYGGVLVSALVLACWGVHAWSRAGWGLRGVRVVLAQRPLVLAACGGIGVLASAPIDNAWHARYGRDAVLWSPPHLLAVAASVTLSVAVLAGLRDTNGQAARVARPLAAAGVLAALLLPVLEYDSDVPQFSPGFYLPVVTAGIVLGSLILRDLFDSRWPVTIAALLATGLRLGIVLFLAGLGMTLTMVAPLLVPAIVDDVLARRGVADWRRAIAIAIAVPASWLPALALQPDTATQVPARLLPQAVLGCLFAALGILVLAGRVRPPRPRVRSLTAILVLAMTLAMTLAAQVDSARPALAHDPGQGRAAGTVALSAARTGDIVRVEATVEQACSTMSTDDAAVVGRRGGRTVRAAATTGPSCSFRGQLSLPADGRWFIYLTLHDRRGHRYESWIPLPRGVNSVQGRKDLYLPPPPASAPGRDIVSALLYLVVAALLAASVHLRRR